ncbi:MAG: o-succinylbenzoate synthase [Bacteroidota bacterium]
MSLKITFQPYTLNFRFEAGTSRGILTEKATYFIKVVDQNTPGIYGLGECGPLKKLSIDDVPDFGRHIQTLIQRIKGVEAPKSQAEVFEVVESLVSSAHPSIRFGLEMALLDLVNGGRRLIFENDFYSGKPTPINGLIWMGDEQFMMSQIHDKISQNFDCVKIKIGAIDFDRECEILNYLRTKFSNKEIMLRVDANGAFTPKEAMEKLVKLSEFQIHSIEQPIKAGQKELMRALCKETPLDIALDEELIGIDKYDDKRELLEYVMPQYIILKPTLVGGFKSCIDWIEIANELEIGWWLTSALESNIGLNAICQFSEELSAKGHQGLGTGKLYHNNIDSPLTISDGHIRYEASIPWDLESLTF